MRGKTVPLDPRRTVTRNTASSSKWLPLVEAVLILAAAFFAVSPPTPALAQGSAANIPFSAISPGGVDMASGELILVMRPDLHLDGPLPVSFERYYASLLVTDGLASGHLGPNWLGTYDWTLSVVGSSAKLVTNRGALIRFTLSPAGSWDLTSPTYAKFRLDVLPGGVWRVTNPLDRRLYFFDGVTWLLTRIQDERGNTLNLTYTGGLLTQVNDGLGRALSFTYDASSLLTQLSDGTRSVHYSYTGGLLTGVLDAAGHAWGYGYVGPGPASLKGVTEPLSNEPVTESYDLSGRVASQMDAMGGISMYSYGTPSGNVYQDPLGNPWSYQHDGLGRLTTRTDPTGGPTSYGYDAQGRVMTITRPMGDPTSFSYDPTSGYPSMMTLADGSSVSWTYSSHLVGGATFFDLSMASYPDGTTESYGRDASGNLTNLSDTGGFPWMGTYNAMGQVLTWTNPTGGVTTFTYDPQGRPMSERDNAGNTTLYAYDGLSRLTQVTWPDANSRHYAYDNLNGLTSMTDERGKLWSYAYDGNERLMTETDPLLEATGFLYDAMDRPTQVVDPLSHATLYGYDPDGRMMSVTDRSGRMTSYQYDALNRLTGVKDPAGGTDLYGYDADSRLVSSQDPLGHSSSFLYDNLDRLTHVTDRVGTGFDYTYDPIGRLHTISGPLGHMLTFNYDPRGLLFSVFDAGSETDLLRTPLGEISQFTDPNRNAWPRSYDPQGRITGSADPLGRGTTYEYDAMSRPIHIGRPDGTVQQIDYDAAGRIIGESFGGGTSFNFSYDDANRLTGATGASFVYDAAGRMTNSNGFAMTYDNEGRILSETLAPGKVVTYTYESRGLLSQVQDWMGGTTSFSYDPARRLTGITRPNGTSATYAYDAADRLINDVESGPGPSSISSIGITRDALGQPTSIARRQPLMPGQTMAATNSFTYDPASQLNGVNHDPLGRMTADASRSFVWDGASRLTHFAAGADSPSYAYDALGQQLTATQGSQVVQQAWNYGWQHPDYDDTEVNLPSPKTTYFVRAPSGLLLYAVDGSSGSRSFYHYDEAGNTAFLTDDRATVATEYAYTPFGGVSALGETAGNPFTYGGAGGMAQLGGSGAFRIGGAIYDANTMRMISGNTTRSGPEAVAKIEHELPGEAVGKIEHEFPGETVGKIEHEFPGEAVGKIEHELPGEAVGKIEHELPGEAVSLNPQPLPPGESVSLNPQPLPPGESVALNPQPFPPGASVSLNPQPFPPAPAGLSAIHGNDLSLGPSSVEDAKRAGGWNSDRGVTWAHPNFAVNDDAPVPIPPWWYAQRARTNAGTFMHELGHTFGLDHGVPFDAKTKFSRKYALFAHDTPCPTHVSSMNYYMQLPGVPTDPVNEGDGLSDTPEYAESIDNILKDYHPGWWVEFRTVAPCVWCAP